MANSSTRDFDGTSNYLDSNSGSGTYDFTGTEHFTVGCWINADDQPGVYNPAVANGANTGSSGWMLGTFSNVVAAAYFGVAGINSSLTMSVDTWYFIAMVCNLGTDVTFYRITEDGTVGTSTSSTASVPNTSTNDLFIGAESSGSGQFFNGQICHVQVWNELKTQAELVEAAMKPGSVVKDLQDYWPVWGAKTTEPSHGINGDSAALTSTDTAASDTPRITYITGR